MTRLQISWIAMFLFAAAVVAGDRELLRKNFLHQQPPEIAGTPAEWLSDIPPTTLEQLRGNVVWLQFNF